MAELYAEIILPLPLAESYTYRVPPAMVSSVVPGTRVVVRFGKSKRYTGVVRSLHHNPPANLEAGEIRDIEPGTGDRPILHPVNLKLWEWIARYYMCPLGDVMKAALPVVLRPDSATILKMEELKEKMEAQAGKKRKTRKKNVIQTEGDAAGDGGIPSETQGELNLLNEYQLQALEEVRAQFQKHPVVLLHGVTASGKTEIYIHLIEEALQKGKQVLYLVPEIALTPQIIQRLSRAFGSRTAVYHSKMSDNERAEVWYRVAGFRDYHSVAPTALFGEGGAPTGDYHTVAPTELSSTPATGAPTGDYHTVAPTELSSTSTLTLTSVVLGARSALFLPFSDLGLIIVDEEHENSYKQYDASPRYHARDMAVVAGLLHKAPVMLGSATPSFESYTNAKSGKYGLVTLTQRHGTAGTPEVIVADTLRAYKRRQMKAMLTPELFDQITEALKNKEQVILFQNRRGYAPYVECLECGFIPQCAHCDVSLTYHKNSNRLQCHYCGFSQKLPATCAKCGAPELKTRGFGTEKVEDEIAQLFPEARISRMDLDTTRSKTAFDKLIHLLEKRKTDILVGTQMVTKGLDLEHVSVVGVLNADNLINHPDFRAHERAFQMLLQVSGRPGRMHNRGTVVIQTSDPGHPVIGFVKNHDYEGLYNSLMPERKEFRYPPWYRLIKIIVKHHQPEQAANAAILMADALRKSGLFTVLGPEAPLAARVNLWYIREIWLKTSRSRQINDLREVILTSAAQTREIPGNSGVLIQVDVDAV